MTTRYFPRRKAAALLKDNRANALWIQILLSAAECTLYLVQVICLYATPSPWIGVCAGALGDLLLISPLKAGRALFYKSCITQTNIIPFAQVFSFFKTRYWRSVVWRARLWILRIFTNALFCAPSAAMFFVCLQAENNNSSTIAIVAFSLAVIFFVFALILTEIVMFRYIPAVYLLTENTVRQAFKTAKRCNKKFLGQWTLFFLDFAAPALLFGFIIPYFRVTPTFHAGRAATVLRLFDKNSERNDEQHLKQNENHGKMVGEF